MKRAFRYIGLVLLCPFLLITILTALLYVPSVQKWAVNKVATIASEETGMQISVGHVGLDFPLDLGLERVVIVRQSDTIANIGKALVHVELLPLLKKQVVIDQFAVGQADINTLDLVSDVQVHGRVGWFSLSSHCIYLDKGIVSLNNARLNDTRLTVLLSDTAATDTTTTELPWLIQLDSLVVARTEVEVHTPGDSMQVAAYMGETRLTEGVFDLLESRYTVRSFNWQHGRLLYDQNFEARLDDGFDYNHLALTGIRLGLDSIFFCSPELMLRVRHATLKEQSGLELSQMEGSLLMDSAAIRLPRLLIKTPYSNMRAHVNAGLNLLDSIHPGQLAVDIDASIGRQDLMTLLADEYPTLPSQWPSWPLDIRMKAAGSMERAAIEEMSITLPTAFHAEASGYAGLSASQQQYPLHTDLQVQATSYDLNFLSAFVPDYGKDYQVPHGTSLKGVVQASGPVYAAHLTLSDGNGSMELKGHLDQRGMMSYDADATVSQFNLSRFLPSLPLGHLTAVANAKGTGTDFLQKTCWMEADAHVRHLDYDGHHLDSIIGTVRLNDGHAIASITGHNQLFDGIITTDALLNTDRLRATCGTELNRLNLYALGVADKPLSVGACGHIDINSNLKEQHYLSGLFSELYIEDSLSTYRPLDVGLLLNTRRDTTIVRIQSGNFIVKMDAKGGMEHLAGQFTRLADSLSAQLYNRTIDQPQIKRLLPTMRLYVTSGKDNPVANFLHSAHGIDFSDILIDFTSSPQEGVNGTSHILKLNANSTRIDTVRFNIVEKKHGITFNGIVANNKRNPQLVFRMLFDGRLQEHGGSLGMRYFDADGRMGLRIGTQAAMTDDGINFHLVPERPLIGYQEYSLNADNFLCIQNNLRLKAKVDLITDDGNGIKIYSEDQDSTLLQDLTVSLSRFDLGRLTEVLPFMPRITGLLNGDFHLVMDDEEKISMVSDMDVRDMTYESNPLGNISTEFVYLQREDDTHALEGILMLAGEEVGGLRGEYRDKGEGSINAELTLTRFPLDMVNGFIPEQIIGFEGFAEGEMVVQGTARNLNVNGEVLLDSAALISQPYGMRLRFDNDPVRIADGRLLLENFTMYAYNDEPLNIMGDVDFHNTERITMDMRMRARNYQIINSKQTANSIAYGKAFVNFFARLNGRLDQLRMRGRLDVLGSTDLTYILLDSPLSTDNQLDELVKFTDFTETIETKVERPTPDGLDIDLTLNIDQGTHVLCALNADQSNYVNLFGGGDLRMKYNTDGISMTGRYTMSSGEMKYSLPVIPLKTFTIHDGSYVEFTGDPMNPRLNLTAIERTRASVGNEGSQSRSVLFDCGVVITKTLNDMGMEFIIAAPEDNAVASELSAMTVEQRGKLAVTMLTTGMYLSDGNTSGFSMNSALSSFLQSEINNITGNALKTLDLSVGLDNTTDASGAMHTDYSFKFAKRFWNNRLKVQIGGKVSSGQDDATQGQNQSFFDNVTMEYRLSDTSNQYVKLFYQQNVYDWLEGYTSEYGGGFVWRRRLSNFWDILRFWRKEQQYTRPAMTRPQQNDSIKVNENK